MAHRRRFNFRCDQSFLDAIDDWRTTQRPVPSQSEAIRMLALRGATLDSHLSVILENSLSDLISAGVFAGEPGPEIYERFQNVVTMSLDQIALMQQQDRQTAAGEPTSDALHAAPEKHSQDRDGPTSRRYSR